MVRQRLLGPVRFTLVARCSAPCSSPPPASSRRRPPSPPPPAPPRDHRHDEHLRISPSPPPPPTSTSTAAPPTSACSVWVARNNAAKATEALFTNVTGSRTLSRSPSSTTAASTSASTTPPTAPCSARSTSATGASAKPAGRSGGLRWRRGRDAAHAHQRLTRASSRHGFATASPSTAPAVPTWLRLGLLRRGGGGGGLDQPEPARLRLHRLHRHRLPQRHRGPLHPQRQRRASPAPP